MVKNKLAIVGFSPTSLYEAFELGDDFEVWGINELYTIPDIKLEKFTRWFEIHDRELYDDLNIKTEGGARHIKALSKMPIPVYMQNVKNYNDVPNAVEFPANEMIDFFKTKYFTNTPAWLVAFAVYEGFKKGNFKKYEGFEEIHVYGVDMASGWYNNSVMNEYSAQRPSCEYFLGIIKGLELAGVKVKYHIPKKSSLLKKFALYGYETLEQNVQMQIWDEQLKFIQQTEKNLMNNLESIQQKAQSEIQKIQFTLARLKGQQAQIDMDKSNF